MMAKEIFENGQIEKRGIKNEKMKGRKDRLINRSTIFLHVLSSVILPNH